MLTNLSVHIDNLACDYLDLINKLSGFIFEIIKFLFSSILQPLSPINYSIYCFFSPCREFFPESQLSNDGYLRLNLCQVLVDVLVDCDELGMMLCDLQVHSSMVLGGLLDYLVIFRSSARHLQKGVHFMLRDLYEVALHGKPVISALL